MAMVGMLQSKSQPSGTMEKTGANGLLGQKISKIMPMQNKTLRFSERLLNKGDLNIDRVSDRQLNTLTITEVMTIKNVTDLAFHSRYKASHVAS